MQKQKEGHPTIAVPQPTRTAWEDASDWIQSCDSNPSHPAQPDRISLRVVVRDDQLNSSSFFLSPSRAIPISSAAVLVITVTTATGATPARLLAAAYRSIASSCLYRLPVPPPRHPINTLRNRHPGHHRLLHVRSTMTQLSFDSALLSSGGLHVSHADPILHVTLIRETALNALLPATFHSLHHILDVLQSSKAPAYILLTGRGRAFSAGGDVRSLRTALLSAGPPNTPERVAAAQHVLSTEYDLLARWASLPPSSRIVTVALGTGLAFGAGAGLFQACAVCLVTGRFSTAMPEARIGLIPDCGATRFFARLPGCVGMFLALTGARVGARDAVGLGLADGAMGEGWAGLGLEQGEVNMENARKCCVGAETLGEAGELADEESGMRRGIDEVFCGGSLAEVVEGLKKRAGMGETWAMEAVTSVEGAAPKALKETFEVMRRAYAGRGEGLRAALDRELEVESRLAAAKDFEEGVRAALVDKDGKPRWELLEEEVAK